MAAVDESKLDTTIRSLDALIATYDERIQQIDKCRMTLEKLRMVDGKPPVDSDTGAVMSAARRREVYAACIPAAEKMLGLEEEGEGEAAE